MGWSPWEWDLCPYERLQRVPQPLPLCVDTEKHDRAGILVSDFLPEKERNNFLSFLSYTVCGISI